MRAAKELPDASEAASDSGGGACIRRRGID